jgi:hypothetical protein
MSDHKNTEEKPKEPQTPFEYLALFPGAPDASTIESFKQMVPGGRLRLLPMKDGKRLFLLRGFTSLELLAAQNEASKVVPEKQITVLQTSMAVRCTLWTSIVKSGKLTEADLASSGAGLSATLYHTIMDLSDYNDPQVLEQLFVDL